MQSVRQIEMVSREQIPKPSCQLKNGSKFILPYYGFFESNSCIADTYYMVCIQNFGTKARAFDFCFFLKVRIVIKCEIANVAWVHFPQNIANNFTHSNGNNIFLHAMKSGVLKILVEL